MTAKKIALFIDADNISPKYGKQIIDTLSERGEIFIRRIYGNWEKIPLRGWNDGILNFSLRAIQQPDFTTGKNATDMSLTIDAMDVLYDGKADIFALVSNDSDFTPLAIRLREGGINTIGLGTSKASNAFRAACNEFIELDAVAEVKAVAEINAVQSSAGDKKISLHHEKKSPAQMSLFDAENSAAPVAENSVASVEKISPPKSDAVPEKNANPKVVSITAGKNFDAKNGLQKIHNILREAAQVHGDSKGFVAMCWAGQSIHNENLGFGVKDLGYGSLNKFVADFPDMYEIIQRDNGENFCYRCRTTSAKKSPAVTKTTPLVDDNDNLQKFHWALREAVKTYANEEGFANLCSVGSYVIKKKLGFGVKSLGYGTLQKFLDAFPDLYELRKLDGNKIFLRCRVTNATENSDDRIKKLHDILQKTATTHADETGFTNLSYAGNCLGKNKIGFGIRSLGYGTLSKFVSSFPMLYEVQQSGKLFRYRCKRKK